MITISFEGGLGNQLFQFAYARYLQKTFKDGIIYDISKYVSESTEYRNFELDSFSIPKDWIKYESKGNRLQRFGWRYPIYLIVTAFFIGLNKFYAKYHNGKHIWCSAYQRLINRFGFYREHFNEYRQPLMSKCRNKLVRGQWIWPEMVMEQGESLKDDIKVITPLSQSNKLFLSQILSTNSVGVHIRRGDYVKLGLIVCDINYYERCIEKMLNLVKNPVFFIFSDDIEWVKNNLNTKDAELVFIDNNNSSPEDMRLLYSCNHFIISNSTFSLWGAYLGRYKDKKVIVPEFWSIKKKKSRLILSDWIVERNL